jgi:hypothetical protein
MNKGKKSAIGGWWRFPDFLFFNKAKSRNEKRYLKATCTNRRTGTIIHKLHKESRCRTNGRAPAAMHFFYHP